LRELGYLPLFIQLNNYKDYTEMSAKDDYDRGLVELNQKKYDAALSSFKLAFKQFADPNEKAQCLYTCGVLYYETNRYSSATRYFMRAKDLFPENLHKARCEYSKGVVHEKNFEEKLAMKAFNNALSLLSPKANWNLKSDIYLGYASLYASITLGDEFLSYLSENKRKKNQQHLKNAILYFNEALMCDEKSPSSNPERKGAILFDRAGIYDKLDDHQKAHDDYTAAYDLNPNLAKDNVTTLNTLTHFVIHFPELYQTTLKKLLLPKQLEYVKKITPPKSTLEGFEKVALSLPQDADGNTKLQIYLDCGVGYKELAFNYISFSKEKMEKNLQHYKKAIQYYNLALTCLEGIENDAELQGEIFFSLGQLYDVLNERQNAHEHYTSAYKTDPKLVSVTATDKWIKFYIKKYPQFYENTFEPLLSKEQKESAARIKFEIQKSIETKKKFHGFRTKIPLFSTSDKSSEKKSEPERPDHGNYFLLSDDQDRGNKFR
jgi:tetratricopeptide (TPR) repeat protein